MNTRLNPQDLVKYSLPIAAREDVLAEVIVAAAAVQVGGIFVLPPPRDGTDDMIVGELVVRLLLALRERGGSSYYRYHNPFAREGDNKLLDPLSVSLDDLERHRFWLRKTGPDSYEIYPTALDYLFVREVNPAAGIIGMVRDYFAAGSNSDFVSNIRAYRASYQKKKQLQQAAGRNASTAELDQQMFRWNSLHFLSPTKIYALEESIWRMEKLVRQASLQLPASFLTQQRDFDANALTKALAAGMAGGVSTSYPYGRNEYKSNENTFSLAYSSVLGVSDVRRPNLILAANIFPLNSKRGEQITIADMAAPLKPEWLHEVWPDLVQEEWLDDHEFDLEKVHATRILRFGELEIDRQTMPCRDEKAQAAFRRWLAQSMGAA